MKYGTMSIVGVLTLLLLAVASRAEIKIAVDRSGNESGAAEFTFKNVPSPSQSDAAAKAKFTLVEGHRPHRAGTWRGMESEHGEENRGRGRPGE
jgi:hypothetical protein